ncbi:MAG: choice-of-anchor J domain-containing protein [Candidatus Cloacimonetes bacterium]|nr:choice-of-anchor J domain-containing protein [Candidatus Cloacimonadota bacterium]
MRKLFISLLISFVIISALTAIGGDTFEDALLVQSLPYNDTGDISLLTDTIEDSGNDAFYRIHSSVQLTNTMIAAYSSSFPVFSVHIYDLNHNQLWEATHGLDGLTLQANTDYYICVDSQSQGFPFNGYYSFYIEADFYGNLMNTPAPSILTNVLPANAEMNVSQTIDLSWNFGANTETYDLYFDSVYPPNTQVVFGAIADTTGSYTTQGLERGTTYYWKVISYNSLSPFSTTTSLSFTTSIANHIRSIGNGSILGSHLPIENGLAGTYSQTIYLQSEINIPNRMIDRISYHYNGVAPLLQNNHWHIYMGHTTNDEFENNADWIPINQLTEVYDGFKSYRTQDNWEDIILDTPFPYNNVDNLVIAVLETYSFWPHSYGSFNASATPDNRSLCSYDVTSPDPEELSYALYCTPFIPNIRISFCSSMYPNYLDFGEWASSRDLVLHNDIAPIVNILEPPILTGEDSNQFSIIDQNTYPIRLREGNEITISIAFNPTSEGHKSAILAFSYNQNDGSMSNHEINLLGICRMIDSNNSSFTATEIQPDVLGNEYSIYPNSYDDDYYVFWQSGPAHIEIHTEGLAGSAPDIVASLFGPFDNIGQYVDSLYLIDYDAIGWIDNYNPMIVADITETGFYYIKIEDRYNFPFYRTSYRDRPVSGDYSLWVITDNHTLPPGLYPPSNLSDEISYDGVFLTWDAPVSADRSLAGYNIYRDDVRVNSETVPDNFYSDPAIGLNFNQSYEYNVTAFYSGPMGESVPSDSIMVTFLEFDPPIINESFEDYDDFATSFGYWECIDLDGENTYGFNNGVDFPNENEPMSFIVFAPNSSTPPLPMSLVYTGSKSIACFAADSNMNDDWLISPQIQLTNENSFVSFMARSYSTQYGMEELEIAVSTGSSDPDDFILISGNDPLQIPLAWTRFRFEMNHFHDQVIRVALHSVSNQTIALFVDDVMVMNDGGFISTESNPDVQLPTSLIGNFPNPFNPETTISFNLKETTHATLDIFNIRGQHVANIADANFTAGTHNIVWRGTDYHGNSVSSGIYFYKLQAGTYTKTRKMILMK